MATGNVSAVALLADALPGLTAKWRPDMNPGYAGGNNFSCLPLVNLSIAGNYGFSSAGINQFTGYHPASYSVSERW